MSRLSLIVLFAASTLFAQSAEYHLHGKIVDAVSGAAVPGCTIYLKTLRTGCITDSTGTFHLTLRKGTHQVSFSHISYLPLSVPVTIPRADNATLVIKLQAATLQQKEIKVTAKRTDIGAVQDMQAKDITRVPTVFNDVLRSITVLSGVVSNNELSSGYSVRGGNYSENLVYLNGYEIYRPFLLRQGTEENQTLINPDMVESLTFYNGSFPVVYGDKMSSALAVQYSSVQDDKTIGKIRAGLLNGGITFGKKFSGFTLLAGGRYAYPGLFVNKLQTAGGYHPAFADVQLLGTVELPGYWTAELFAVQSKNTFNTTPVNWTGNFRDANGGGMVSAVDIHFSGKREYSLQTGLYAARFRKAFRNNASVNFSYAFYRSQEQESGNVFGMYFYQPDATHPDENVEYLKSRFETSDNQLRLTQHSADIEYLHEIGTHTLRSGLHARFRQVQDVVYETARDTGAANLIDEPLLRKQNRSFQANEFSGFIADSYKPTNTFSVNAGIRFTYVQLSSELLISPRAEAEWFANSTNKLFAGFGLYYQPPYYLEGRLNDVPVSAQRAIHYSIGWENRFKPNITFRIEAYYKDLDKLIPYYTEGQKIVYSGGNTRTGYATGFDAMFQGEIVEGIQSWLGYGYLNTKDRPKAGGEYLRRLTDQTHSLLFFLQDRIKKHRNWQVHTRFLIGTGQLYNNRIIQYNESLGKYLMTVDMNSRDEYFLYMRADMGCSVEIPFQNESKLRVTAEVLNVFNTYNYAGYQFVQVFTNIPKPVRIPEVLSSRFFNLQLEYEL